MKLSDSCPCGATFSASAIFPQPVYDAWQAWLEKHEDCRAVALTQMGQAPKP